MRYKSKTYVTPDGTPVGRLVSQLARAGISRKRAYLRFLSPLQLFSALIP